MTLFWKGCQNRLQGGQLVPMKDLAGIGDHIKVDAWIPLPESSECCTVKLAGVWKTYGTLYRVQVKILPRTTSLKRQIWHGIFRCLLKKIEIWLPDKHEVIHRSAAIAAEIGFSAEFHTAGAPTYRSRFLCGSPLTEMLQVIIGTTVDSTIPRSLCMQASQRLLVILYLYTFQPTYSLEIAGS